MQRGLRFQDLPVDTGIRPPALRPAIEILQLHAKHGGLNRVQSEVSAENLIVVLGLESMIAQEAQSIGKFGAVRRHHTGITEPAKVLRREEAEAGEIPY